MHFRTKFLVRLALILAAMPVVAPALHAQWDKDVFSLRGRHALSEGRYSLAIENFNVLASLDTTDYWTFFFRGIAKYNLGDLRGAQKDFNTSVRLNPVFTNGYHYRAITESRFGKYDEAFRDYEKAISLRPGSEGLYYSRGVTYFLSQQFNKAVDDFNRYIRRQPKDPSAYLNRGASLLFLGDTTAAFNDYNKAIKLDRFDAEGYVRRGRLYAACGRLKEGIADLDRAIELDKDNSFALFNRALMLYDNHEYVPAMNDLNRVLEQEPGNALTLYNRGLIKAQVGDLNGALEDLDRVVNINPENVLVYFNRAAIFIEMGRYQDALEDYDKAIELYPDFAKAYMNRSYVKNLLGRTKSSREDYNTAQRKISEYRAKNVSEAGSFADTTRKYNSLIALDAEFAKKDFNDEILQYRDVDVQLRPLYKFALADAKAGNVALQRRYENPATDRFIGTSPVPIEVTNTPSGSEHEPSGIINDERSAFLAALYDYEGKQFNSALANYDLAISRAPSTGRDAEYQAFNYMNRGVLRAEMIDFIASIENNVQVLSMDESGNTRARVKDRVNQSYDYTEAIDDMKKAAAILPSNAYIMYDLGNLYCLASDHISSIRAYTEAIKAYPYMGDAYYNRALVQIYLRDKEKGCNDLSVAGQLGVKEAYAVIKKYCEQDEVH
ncbi:MAG: tetratricopeptide repeat protein [Bacteroidales bacterium]|nr:tetratricopeptide repeat protein [Bacteroidales bacterium]